MPCPPVVVVVVHPTSVWLYLNPLPYSKPPAEAEARFRSFAQAIRLLLLLVLSACPAWAPAPLYTSPLSSLRTQGQPDQGGACAAAARAWAAGSAGAGVSRLRSGFRWSWMRRRRSSGGARAGGMRLSGVVRASAGGRGVLVLI